MLALFIEGFIIGLAIAAPVGPIGVLCIQRSLMRGFKIGLMTGLGAAFADGVYGVVVGFGLTAISSFLIRYQYWIQLVGGFFLLYLGIKFLFMPSQKNSINDAEQSMWHACATTFFLTLTNPATILSFIAVFVGLGLGTTETSYIDAIFLVSGIILGSGTWWLFLSGGVVFVLHHRLTPRVMHMINGVSGVIILAFAILCFMRL